MRQPVTTIVSNVRDAQIKLVGYLAPMIVVCNVFAACVIIWMFEGSGTDHTKYIWLSVLGILLGCYLCVGVLGILNRDLATQSKRSKSRSNPDVFGIALNVLALMHGTLWGWSAYYFSLAESSDWKSALVICLVSSMTIGGMGFAAMSSAAALYVVPILIGSAYGLWLLPESNVISILAVLLVCIGVATLYAARFFTHLLNSHSATLSKINKQNAVVTMLLDALEQDTTTWVWETDANGVFTHFPSQLFPQFGEGTAVSMSEFLQDIVKISGTHTSELNDAFENNLRFENIALCVYLDRGEGWLRLSGQPIENDKGEVIGFVGTGSDITSEKLAEDRIEKLSHNDNLTGLMNRSAFSSRLSQSVSNLERYGRPFSILYLDIDGFKLVNNMRGHQAGDSLLTQVGERIKREVGDAGSVARLAGDEFAILLDSQGDAGVAARLAGRLITSIGDPYRIDDEELSIGSSIGIALAPLNGTRPDQLLRNADLAVYRAKADGRGVFRFFENNMDAELRERRVLEGELRDSVANDELVLHYQPLVDAKTRKTIGMESLIRWQHPIRGLLSPIEFVALAEQSSLICEIGAWTLKTACVSAMEWPEDMFVAVNLSASHFMQTDIVAEVAEILEETGFDAGRLELEITESLLIHDSQCIVAKLDGLKELGVSVAMDDFGTGYSSLSYLMNVPFDKLKIDKSFVDEITENAAGRKIVRMITNLAGELHLNVTAEGVECEDQAQFLVGIGCDILQGYLFSKPMPEDMLPAYFLKSAQLPTANEDGQITPKLSKDEVQTLGGTAA